MKSRTKSSKKAEIENTVKQLTNCGVKPTFCMLENKVSGHLLKYLEETDITVQQVPASCHWRSATERAIRILKNYIIASIYIADDKFPLNKWDTLTSQVVIMINLLQQSRLNLKISIHAQAHGIYNADATLKPSSGTKIPVHEKLAFHGTWIPHGANTRYFGSALNQHRCYRVFVEETRGNHIANTVVRFPTKGSPPQSSSTDITITTLIIDT